MKIKGPPSKNKAQHHELQKEKLPKLDTEKGKNKKSDLEQTERIKLKNRRTFHKFKQYPEEETDGKIAVRTLTSDKSTINTETF